MIIEPVLLGYYLYCNVNYEGVTCSRNADKYLNQKTYISQYEIKQGNMIITTRNNQIYNLHWRNLESCKQAMNGYARCILIPLINNRKNSNKPL